MIYDCLINNIIILSNTIEIHYECTKVKYAWLENFDKNIPDIFTLNVIPIKYYMFLDHTALSEIAKRGIIVKLSISDEVNKINYSFVSDFQFPNIIIDNLNFRVFTNNQNELLFELTSQKNKEKFTENKYDNYKLNNVISKKKYVSNFIKSNLNRIPLDIVVLGTCFSRSIFKSDPYFNTDYKNRNHTKYFSIELKKRDLDKKCILIGSRLCEKKIDKKTSEITQWENLLYWVKSSNQNWDIVDQIFLEEIPNAAYIDMRKTKWLSDIDCPIEGGASPSHYQSEYYREILDKIKKIIFNH